MKTDTKADRMEQIKSGFAVCEQEGTKLNEASDRLGRLFDTLNARIGRLAIGVSAWHQYARTDRSDGWSRYIGYSQINGKWGLALKQARDVGNEHEEKVWWINDAPRWMRIDAVANLVDLLSTLADRTRDMTAQVNRACDFVGDVVDAIEKEPE